jgi:hypothetical protein
MAQVLRDLVCIVALPNQPVHLRVSKIDGFVNKDLWQLIRTASSLRCLPVVLIGRRREVFNIIMVLRFELCTG